MLGETQIRISMGRGFAGDAGSALQSTPGSGTAPFAMAGDTIVWSVVPCAFVRLLMVVAHASAAEAGLKSGAQPDDVAGA